MKKLIALALWLLSLPLAAQNMNDHNYDVPKTLRCSTPYTRTSTSCMLTR